jgi:hypothetical protein
VKNKDNLNNPQQLNPKVWNQYNRTKLSDESSPLRSFEDTETSDKEPVHLWKTLLDVLNSIREKVGVFQTAQNPDF